MRWLGVLVGAVLLAGCASAVDTPSAGSPSVEHPAPVTLPPRPRPLPLDGVQPCALLTPAQRAGLGLDPRADPFVDDSRLYGAAVPSCLFQARSPRATTVATGIVKTVGVERFLGGDIDAELRVATAAGYPALVAVPRVARDYCTVLIDVAPSQLVDVVYRDVALPPPIPQSELCAEALQVAAEVVRTASASP